MTETHKICQSCGKDVPIDDPFCPFCGATMEVSPTPKKQHTHKLDRAQKSVRTAANWILAISILFVIFGTIFGFINQSQAADAHRQLAGYNDTDVLTIDGVSETYTAAELRKQIDTEVMLVFVTNYFLAVIMFGFYLWARRSPFPAMIMALCVYLAVIAFNAILDPTTIFHGIIIKVIFIGALVAGIKAALVARELSIENAEPESRLNEAGK